MLWEHEPQASDSIAFSSKNVYITLFRVKKVQNLLWKLMSAGAQLQMSSLMLRPEIFGIVI